MSKKCDREKSRKTLTNGLMSSRKLINKLASLSFTVKNFGWRQYQLQVTMINFSTNRKALSGRIMRHVFEKKTTLNTAQTISCYWSLPAQFWNNHKMHQLIPWSVSENNGNRILSEKTRLVPEILRCNVLISKIYFQQIILFNKLSCDNEFKYLLPFSPWQPERSFYKKTWKGKILLFATRSFK